MATFDFCLSKESNKQPTLDINVVVQSKSKWKSSSEALESPTNSNDMLSFSADDATSESEFDEHPYSVSKTVKKSFNNHRKHSTPQPTFATKKAKTFISEDIEDSSWPMSNVENEMNKYSSKTRRRGSKCESKNAVMARLNRLKKKKYVADLENRNAKLEAENELLKRALAKRLKEVSSLKRETVNLQSVIKNSTEIGSLLQCVQKNTNLHVTSSLLRSESSSEKHPSSNKSRSDRTICTPSPVIDEQTNNEKGMIPEINLFRSGKQSIITKTNPSCLFYENLLVDDTCDFNFDMGLGTVGPADNDLLCELKGEINSNCFLNANRSPSTEFKVTEFANELLRCETPSKDVDISVPNNDFLFDDVGVCFHIANKRVSLEFCDSCNHKAANLQ